MFSVGDVVKVIKVIETDNCDRNAEKNVFIGTFVSIKSILPDDEKPRYEGQIYHVSGGTNRVFHADELQLVEKTKKPVPEIGDHVYLAGSKKFRKVKEIVVQVKYVNDNGIVSTGQYIGVVPQNVVFEHEKEALLKEQRELVLKAKETMDEASKVAAKLAQLELDNKKAN
jgi:hypothetical protein